jgi:formate hydrogenlyase subunit 6/NADH:ubiquinone oxidoreductase subunit I
MRLGTMLKDVIAAFFQKPITQEYPFERTAPTERLRGRLTWDPATCTGCGLCSKDCPSEALEWVVNDKKNKRFVLRYNMGNCTFCSQCVISCRTGSMSMNDEDWELAALTKEPFEIYFGKEEDVAAFLECLNCPPEALSEGQPAETPTAAGMSAVKAVSLG